MVRSPSHRSSTPAHTAPRRLWSRRFTGLLSLLSASLFLLGMPSAHAQPRLLPDTLSFETAQRYFLLYNPDLAEARARAARALAEDRIPALWPNPALEGDAETASSQQSLVLDQPIPNPVARRARIAAARAEARAALATYREEAGDLYLELRRRYLAAAVAETRLQSLQTVTQTVERTVSVARVRLEEGDLGPYDVARLELALAAYQDDLAAARSDGRTARAALAAFIAPLPAAGADTLHTAFVAADTLRYVPLELNAVALAERAVELRARLVAAHAGLDAAEHALRAERAARWPGISVRAGLGREAGSDGATIGPVVGLGLEVPLWNRNGPQIQAAEAAITEAEAALEGARREVLLDVEAAFARLQSYQDRLARISETRLVRSDTLLQDALFLYQEGEFGLVELLDAADAAREAQQLRLDLLEGYLESRYALDRATGFLPDELLPKELEPPTEGPFGEIP